MVCGQVKIGPFGPVSGYEDRWLKQGKIRAFHTICTGKSSVLFVSTNWEFSSPRPPLPPKTLQWDQNIFQKTPKSELPLMQDFTS